jgi:hypothetical protein
MGTLASLFGSVLLLFLILSGLLLVVAPALGRRMLQKTALGAGLFFLLLSALSLARELIHSINPLRFILGIILVSTLAYFVRERRLVRAERHDGPRPVERLPVMPQHIRGDDE